MIFLVKIHGEHGRQKYVRNHGVILDPRPCKIGVILIQHAVTVLVTWSFVFFTKEGPGSFLSFPYDPTFLLPYKEGFPKRRNGEQLEASDLSSREKNLQIRFCIIFPHSERQREETWIGKNTFSSKIVWQKSSPHECQSPKKLEITVTMKIQLRMQQKKNHGKKQWKNYKQCLKERNRQMSRRGVIGLACPIKLGRWSHEVATKSQLTSLMNVQSLQRCLLDKSVLCPIKLVEVIQHKE